VALCPGWGRDLDLSGRVPSEFSESLDDSRERLRGVDLVSARPPDEGLNLGHVSEHQFPLLAAFAIGIGRRRSMRLSSTSDGALSRTTAAKRS
jgi:hypothetical protein